MLIKIYHYSIYLRIGCLLYGLITPFLLQINNQISFLIFFSIPFYLIFFLWVLFNRTAIRIKNEIIEIKDRDRLFQSKYKFHKKNIILVKRIQQGFINEENRPNPHMSIDYSFYRWYKTKAYKKSMIAIQTNKRVIRIGRTFNEKEILKTYAFLKNNLSLND